MSGVLHPDFRDRPYWWEGAPPEEEAPPPLPSRVDVAVVGAGYAGLATAVVLARAGRSVAVLDAGPAGGGASTRSVGMIGGRLRQGHAGLAATLGADSALALMRETAAAYRWFLGFVAGEGIDCDLRQSGRLIGAWTRRDAEGQKRLAEFLASKVGIAAHCLGPDRLDGEIATDLYRGAMVLPEDGGLDPARLHAGLLALARAAGARICARTPVLGVAEEAGAMRVTTAHGPIAAGDVVLATNAYTGPPFAWYRRRVIPVGSYMAATEPLPPGTLARLLPAGRLVNDTRRLAYAFRASPDGTRLLVGGRASARDHAGAATVAAGLHRAARTLFPDLAGVRMTHAWGGMVAFTVDRLPNIGARGRLHHVLGCNGSGVVMNTYLGARLGRRIAGLDHNEPPTGFARDGLPSHPLYRGRPWFMSPLSAWYGLRDRFDRLADRLN
ncbi:NAD(P)/FAD-dependent oxidoreductase [Stella sp.]|uniref:NAD(P)/FAD-dependent oxidoreductase n=1 Tax=Stella sp. TaxID=2912054 RepID=UPI0035B26454